MTLNWTPGDGDSRIVIAKAGSAVAGTPTNGLDYSLYQSLGPGEVVVYEGAGDSFVFSNDGNGPLLNGMTYYFKIFEFNGSGATTEYLTSQHLAGSQILQTSTTEPSLASGSLSFSSVTGSSMVLNWTSGDGAARVVVAKQGTSVDAVPTDGHSYSPYQSLGNGNYVVAIGNINTLNFSAFVNGPLSINTTYAFRIFEFNGSGNETNYLTTSSVGATQSTQGLATEPTTSPTATTLSYRTDQPHQRIDIRWTKGNGSNTLIVFRAGSPVDDSVLPVDGTSYSLYSSLATGHRVCYVGTGNSMEFKSDGFGDLAPNTTYYFKLFSFNGSGSTVNYKTASPATFNATTVAAPVTAAPSGLTFPSVNRTSMRVRWTDATGASGYLVIAKIGSPVDYQSYDLPRDGTVYSVNQDLGGGNYVIYNSTGTDFTFSSFQYAALTGNTNYHLAVVAYSGTGSSINYLTENSGQVLAGNQTTIDFALAPTTGSSDLTFSNITNTAMTLTWTPGNGQKRLVIAHRNSEVTGTPSDGSDYASYQSLAVNQFVVYNGTGNSFTFADDGYGPLTTGATYHFKIVEYNGTSDYTNYLTSDVLIGSQIAQATTIEPTSASNELIFSDVTNTSMKLSWTNGNGASRIVVFRAGSPVTATPTDGVTYSTYQTLSSGQLVGYVGSGNSFTFSNDGFGPLTQGVTYYFRVYEYNGSGTATNYLTSTFLDGSQIAQASTSEPTIASSVLLFSNVTTSRMALSWTGGNGSNRIVIARAGSPVSVMPSDGVSYSQYQSLASGQIVAHVGSATSFTYANDGFGPLAAGTTYHFAIFEFNGSGAGTNYLVSSFLTGSQTTSMSGSGARIAQSDSKQAKSLMEVVAVEENSIEVIQLDIFPNPTSDYITIQTGNNAPIIIHLISSGGSSSICGQFQPDGDSFSVTLDVRHLSRGFYALSVRTAERAWVKKIILQ